MPATWVELEGQIRAVAGAVIRRRPQTSGAAKGPALVEQVVAHLARHAEQLEKDVEDPAGARFHRLVELVAEYHAQGLGPALIDEIGRVTRRYASWMNEEEKEDLAADVLEELVDRENLAYIMDRVTSLKHFETLVIGRARWCNSKQSTRTTLDNLLTRAGRILRQSPFSKVGRINGKPAYSRAPRTAVIPATPEQLAAATCRVFAVPRIPAQEEAGRAPKVYPDTTLVGILELIDEMLPGGVTAADVRRILAPVLGDYVPTRVAEPLEHEMKRTRQLSAEELVLAEEAAAQILGTLEGEARGALGLMLVETMKIDIAPILGRTRPTIDRRLEDAAPVIQGARRGLTERVQLEMWRQVTDALTPTAFLDVCAFILRRAPFVDVGTDGGTPLYTLAGRAVEIRRPTALELAAVARTELPRSDRERVYSVQWFRRAITIVAETLPTAFAAADAVQVIEDNLTRIRPTTHP